MSERQQFDSDALDRIERKVGTKTLGKIIDLFLESARPRLETACRAADGGDLRAAADALHSLKSSAAMLGASGLFELAETMERTARDGRAAEYAACLPDLKRGFEDAVEFLREQRKGLAS